MKAAAGPCLVGDVGGTSVRFAWVERPGAMPAHEWRGEARAGHELRDDIALYLEHLHDEGVERPTRAAFGVAGPVHGDRVALTNRASSFSRSALRRQLGFTRLLVLNDYAMLAHGLAELRADDARAVGGVPLALERGPDRPRVLVGPGTGLGVAALVPAGRRRVVVVGGEGGHVTLAATDALEDAVVARLRARHGRASAERALSGEGLENLLAALAEIEGRPAPARSDADITRDALAGDALCGRVLDLFFAFLGGIAGDLALTLGADGGVFIGGGIVPRLGDAIDRSPFRRAFEAKGRHAGWMAQVPTALLLDAAGLALRGAAAALDAGRRA